MGNPQEPNHPGQPGAVAPDPHTAAQQPPAPPSQHPAPPQQPPTAHHTAGQDAASQNRGRYAAAGPWAAAGTHAAPFGLPGQPPPVKGRRKRWIILGAAGSVLLLVIAAVVILVNVVGSPTNRAKGLADNFTKLVIAGESSKAYDDYLDPALKQALTKEDFIAGIQSLQMDDSCKPAYDNLKSSSENGANAADVSGLIACDGDKKIDLAYRFEGRDELRMMNIRLKPKA